MRKPILFIFLLIPIFSFSQSLGIKGGINHSWIDPWMRPEDPIPYDGPTVGFVFYPGISKVFDIGIEPSYSIYGMKIQVIPDNNIPKRVVVNFKYVEFPVTLNLFPINKKFVLNLHGGVSPMIFISGTGEPYNARVRNRLQIAPLFGVTAGYFLSKQTFVHLTGRYMFTTRPVYENNPFDDVVYAFNIFAVLGYKF